MNERVKETLESISLSEKNRAKDIGKMVLRLEKATEHREPLNRKETMREALRLHPWANAARSRWAHLANLAIKEIEKNGESIEPEMPPSVEEQEGPSDPSRVPSGNLFE